MEKRNKIILGLVILAIAIFLIYIGIREIDSEDVSLNEDKSLDINSQKSVPSMKYFSSSSDKVVLTSDKNNIYTDNPVIKLTYSAVDKSNNNVRFVEKDRAFVRILGITHIFTKNTEIFHPEYGGVKNYSLFSGDVSISDKEGVYLVKVCLGDKINLNSEGTMVWPFGCFEDETSVQINIHERTE